MPKKERILWQESQFISIQINKTYYVVTNDYLALGGDNMKFFTKATNKYDMDYKLRNVLLAYFSKNNPLPVITTKHIIEE